MTKYILSSEMQDVIDLVTIIIGTNKIASIKYNVQYSPENRNYIKRYHNNFRDKDIMLTPRVQL